MAGLSSSRLGNSISIDSSDSIILESQSVNKSGTVAIVLLVLAGVFIITSFMSFCPLYYPFGISTKKMDK